jgi:hypothetical protein
MAACVQTAPQPAAAPADIPAITDVVATGIGPGSRTPDINTAARLFADVCGKTGGDLELAQVALQRLPVRLNQVSDIWYHQRLNLSFKLIPGRRPLCSFVSAADDNPELFAAGLIVAGASGGSESAARAVEGPDGKVYINAVVIGE